MEILTLANGVSPSTILPFEIGCGDMLMQLQVIIELWVLGYHGCLPVELLCINFFYFLYIVWLKTLVVHWWLDSIWFPYKPNHDSKKENGIGFPKTEPKWIQTFLVVQYMRMKDIFCVWQAKHCHKLNLQFRESGFDIVVNLLLFRFSLLTAPIPKTTNAKWVVKTKTFCISIKN